MKTPREGALDSTTILAISSLARQQADHLNTDFVKFEPIEFAEKLVSHFIAEAKKDKFNAVMFTSFMH